VKPYLFLVLLLVAPLATAQGNLTVVYLEGEAQVSSGSGGWAELSIGDHLSLDAAIRLRPGSLIQVKGPGAGFVLTRPGTFAVPEILAARQMLSAPGVAAVVDRLLRTFAFGPSAGKQATASGVRGANESSAGDDEWTESNAQTFLDAGKEYIKAGEYEKAIQQLREALVAANADEALEIHYCLACALSLMGDVVEAWKEAVALPPGAGSEPWFADFVLLKARLLEETSAYGEAATWLAANDLSQDAQHAALYWFLLGLAYGGSGEDGKARRTLENVAALSGESDLGRAAATILGAR